MIIGSPEPGFPLHLIPDIFRCLDHFIQVFDHGIKPINPFPARRPRDIHRILIFQPIRFITIHIIYIRTTSISEQPELGSIFHGITQQKLFIHVIPRDTIPDIIHRRKQIEIGTSGQSIKLIDMINIRTS